MKLAGKKILVADDEKRLTELIGMNLEEEGAEVVIANDGAEAFRMATMENPDLMLMDLNMPGVNGLEAIRSMRMTMADKPIVVLTGYATASTFESAVKAGASECLSKPASSSKLIEVIEKYLCQQEK